MSVEKNTLGRGPVKREGTCLSARLGGEKRCRGRKREKCVAEGKKRKIKIIQ